MKEIINKTCDYIELLTGEKVVIKPLDDRIKGQLPMFLTGGYDLYKGELFGRGICFAFVDKDSDTTPARYSKRAQSLTQLTDLLPVFVIESVASYNTQRLTRHRVNFIVPGKQLFLPALLMDLGKKKDDVAIPEVIPASAQLLLLYHLEVEPLNGKTGKEIAALIGASQANVTRAIQWLSFHGFAEFIGGKAKHFRFILTGKSLWAAACTYLKSPVLKTVRTDIKPRGLICGQNALAEYEMLIEADHDMLAISQKDYQAVKKFTNTLYGENEIQVWKYNPSKLATKNLVDRLSLYLSMRENTDERVQKELKTLIEEMIWLED